MYRTRICLRVKTFSRAMSSFGVFLQEQKKNPAVKGLFGAKRAAVMGRLYRDLHATEIRRLQKIAKQTKYTVRKTVEKKRKPNAYALFLKEYRVAHPSKPMKQVFRLAAAAWHKLKV